MPQSGREGAIVGKMTMVVNHCARSVRAAGTVRFTQTQTSGFHFGGESSAMYIGPSSDRREISGWSPRRDDEDRTVGGRRRLRREFGVVASLERNQVAPSVHRLFYRQFASHCSGQIVKNERR
jgi:hypothetical protein